MDHSSPLRVLSPSAHNCRTPQSVAGDGGFISISSTKSSRYSDFNKRFNVGREGEEGEENREPTAMGGSPTSAVERFHRDEYHGKDENENDNADENELDDDDDGGDDYGYGVRESSPFLEIPNNAARLSARNTPRKFMTEKNTPADYGNGPEDANGRTTTTTTTITTAGDIGFGMDTIHEVDSDFGSHTPTGAPTHSLGEAYLQENEHSADVDDINITLSEIDPPQEDNAEMHQPLRDSRREDHETEIDHEGDTTSLSTFSAVPHTEMTRVGQLVSQSATKRNLGTSPSPNKKIKHTSHEDADAEDNNNNNNNDNDNGSPIAPHERENRDETSSTFNRERLPTGKNSSLNLLDFTPQRSREASTDGRTDMPGSNRRSRFTSMSPTKNKSSSSRSPSKLSLIDYDMSAPTPMSRPTITPRELESIKSSYMFRITALKATLSGRDAEVDSLKSAVSEAERRVGDALDELRSESARRGTLEAEQAELEHRAIETEKMVTNLKCDMEESTRQKESMARKIEEMERIKVELERKVESVESKLASKADASSTDAAKAEGTASGMFTEEQVEKKVQESVKEVARDLHKLYKEKHETKVTALKKSYAARWEKRVKESEDKLKELTSENEWLKADKPDTSSTSQEAKPVVTKDDEDSTSLSLQNKELQERVDKLEHTLTTLRGDYEALMATLEAERVEKGELVAAVDEWLALQQDESTSSSPDSKRPRSAREKEEEEEEEEEEEKAADEQRQKGGGGKEEKAKITERREIKHQRDLPEPKRRRSTPPISEDDKEQTVEKPPRYNSPRVSRQQQPRTTSAAGSALAKSRLEGQHRPHVQAHGAAGRSPTASRIARFAPSDVPASNSGGGGGGGNSSSGIARPRYLAGPTPRAPRFGLQGSTSASSSSGGGGNNSSNNSSSSGGSARYGSGGNGGSTSSNSSASTSRIAGPSYDRWSNLNSSRSGIMGSIERMGMGGRSRGGNHSQSSHGSGK